MEKNMDNEIEAWIIVVYGNSGLPNRYLFAFPILRILVFWGSIMDSPYPITLNNPSNYIPWSSSKHGSFPGAAKEPNENSWRARLDPSTNTIVQLGHPCIRVSLGF